MSYAEYRRQDKLQRQETMRQRELMHRDNARALQSMAIRTAPRIDAKPPMDDGAEARRIREASLPLSRRKDVNQSSYQTGMCRGGQPSQEEGNYPLGARRHSTAFQLSPDMEEARQRARKRGEVLYEFKAERMREQRDELSELVDGASARVDTSLSSETESWRQQCIEQRSRSQRLEEEAQREHSREFRDATRQACPQLDREALGLSSEAQHGRQRAQEKLQNARGNDVENFAVFSKALHQLCQSAEPRIDATLSPRSEELREKWEGLRQRRQVARSSSMQASAKELRTLVANAEAVVDPYIDGKHRRGASPGASESECSPQMQRSSSETKPATDTADVPGLAWLPGLVDSPGVRVPQRRETSGGQIQAWPRPSITSWRSATSQYYSNHFIDGAIEDVPETQCGHLLDAVENAMSSLGDETKKDEVIKHAESQLEFLARHCDQALALYRQAEEMGPILSEIEEEIQCTEGQDFAARRSLVALRDRLVADRGALLTQAAKSESIAKAFEHQSAEALDWPDYHTAMEVGVAQPLPMPMPMPPLPTFGELRATTVPVLGVPPGSTQLSNLRMGLPQASWHPYDRSYEQTSFMQDGCFAQDMNLTSFDQLR